MNSSVYTSAVRGLFGQTSRNCKRCTIAASKSPMQAAPISGSLQSAVRMASTGKAVHLSAFKSKANPNPITVVNVTAPEPIPAGKVLVEMKMCPVNPADVFSIMGRYGGFTPKSFPAVPGLEGVGIVKALGAGAESAGFKPGQRVVPMMIFEGLKQGNGSWQQFIAADPAHLYAIPDKVSDESAAQLVVNPMTAWGMIHELAPPKGEWLIQSAAGSVIGRQTIQLCKHLGIKTINIVRRKEELTKELQALGGDVVVGQDDDIPKIVKEATGGKGAWGATDCVAGDTTLKITTSLRDGGTCLIYGGLSGVNYTSSAMDAIFRDVNVKGFWISQYAAQIGPAKCKSLADSLIQLMEAGVLEPYSGQVFPVDQVAEAVKASGAAARGGKVLLAFK